MDTVAEFFVCFAKKLAPARKISRLARSCNSAIGVDDDDRLWRGKIHGNEERSDCTVWWKLPTALRLTIVLLNLGYYSAFVFIVLLNQGYYSTFIFVVFLNLGYY